MDIMREQEMARLMGEKFDPFDGMEKQLNELIDAGNENDLIVFGDWCNDNGSFNCALKAYVAAGNPEKLVEFGNLCWDDDGKAGNCYTAEAAYAAAGIEPPENKVSTYIFESLEKGFVGDALRLSKKYGIDIHEKLLLEHAGMYLSEGNPFIAEDLYETANNKDGLVDCGKQYLEMKLPGYARTVFRKAVCIR